MMKPTSSMIAAVFLCALCGPAWAEAGEWAVATYTDSLGGSVTAVVTADPERSVGLPRPAKLVLRCRSRQLDLLVGWGMPIGTDDRAAGDYKIVGFKVGAATGENQNWDVSVDGRITIAPADQSRTIIRQMLADPTSVVAQTVPTGRDQLTAVFDISNIREAAGHVAAACGTSLDAL